MTADGCTSGDTKCQKGGFDTPIALGAFARPETRIVTSGSTGPGFHYESAAPSILEVEGGRILGKSEGTSALLFVSDDHAVLDFLHVWVKKPNALGIRASAVGTTSEAAVNDLVELMPGESIWASTELTADGQHLTGTGAEDWSVEPPIAIVLRGGSEGHRRIVAQRPGNATVRVKSLGLESTLELVVRTPGESAPPVKPGKGGAS